MKKLSLLTLAGAILAAPFSTSHATLAGLSDPWGRTTNPDEVRSAVWDSFNEVYSSGTDESTTYTYTGNASGTSTLTNLSLTQSSPHISSTTTPAQTAQGAGLLDGGDVYYSSTRAQSWTLTATTSIDITSMSFQIKTANVNAISLESVFQPTLTGIGAATNYKNTLVTGEFLNGFQVYVIEYRWTNLDIDAGTTFDITFGLVGGNSGNFTRKPIDFVALDTTTAVPEPSTYAMVALGLGLVAWQYRRRTARVK
jgi:hypothetical protein